MLYSQWVEHSLQEKIGTFLVPIFTFLADIFAWPQVKLLREVLIRYEI